ncbi:type II toxin-antitoxin system RelE/ParE family toxin [Sulfurimonas sediminis]|uniref:Type II toxin-antitoxin system RelE/ParE family toxin n=1 Tax=Sulfurimonas sediminis TaxID=2590020 RepID=A0A7M1B270_9BACT|nr:type II toxin-antitoxin system RelE/ParE family toxin [Sulfurimonas sediminis]QOP43841.1 type II toxin-antitoxin system RelE/ParE family toxin [Sulfurimonas sediminis]
MYELHFLTSAKKEFKKLDTSVQKIIKEKLLLLITNPDILKNNIKPLKGEYRGKFRLRVHQYRVVFQVKDAELIIIVVRIGHRKEVY